MKCRFLSMRMKLRAGLLLGLLLGLPPATSNANDLSVICLGFTALAPGLLCGILLEGTPAIYHEWQEGRIGGCYNDLQTFSRSADRCELLAPQVVDLIERILSREDVDRPTSSGRTLRQMVNLVLHEIGGYQRHMRAARRRMNVRPRRTPEDSLEDRIYGQLPACWEAYQVEELKSEFARMEKCYEDIFRVQFTRLIPVAPR